MSGIMLNILGASFGGASVGLLGLIPTAITGRPKLAIRNDELYATVNSSGFIVLKLGLDLGITWQKTVAISASTSIAIDSTGNVLAAGNNLNGSIQNGYVVKYDSSGAVQWQRQIDGNTQIRSIALDSADDIYCTGYSNILSTATDLYLARFNPSGTIQYQRNLVPNFSLTELAEGIAITSPTAFTIVGTNTSVNRAFNFIGLQADGETVSASEQRSVTTRAHRGVAVVSGEAAGAAYSLVDRFSTSSLTSVATSVIIRMLNGVFSWQNEYASASGSVTTQALCMDPSGTHIYAAYAQVYNATGRTGLQLNKYLASTGDLVYQRGLTSTTANIVASSIAVDSFDNVYVFSSLNNGSSGGLVLKMPGNGAGVGSSVTVGGIAFSYIQTTGSGFATDLTNPVIGVGSSATSPTILTPAGVPADSTLTTTVAPL